MKLNIKISSHILLYAVCFFALNASCQSKSQVSEKQSVKKPNSQKIDKISKATFFLENSGSMFGYVNGITEYVQVVSELSHKSEFVIDNVVTEFNFINGDNIVITPLGKDPDVLKSKLNSVGYNVGNTKKSNLNGMFQKALLSAGNGNISILISDGIYDVGNSNNPLSALSIEGQATKAKFIDRLKKSNIQTLLIKLNSDFKGNYCFASKVGSQNINHKRPYYIWIFGESQLLNKYFPEEYFSAKLKGYENYARFVNPENNSFSFQVVPNNKIGSFKFDSKNKNLLLDAKPAPSGQFQFTVAVDFSSLPFSEQYLTSPSNYTVNSNYIIVSIKRPSSAIHGPPFNTSHLITLSTKTNPYGFLNLSLKNIVPPWIASTNSDNESNINNDIQHTFGLKILTDGISQAYQDIAKSKTFLSILVDIKP